MPVNKRIKLWCKDDMVRAIVMVRNAVPTREPVMCPEPRLDGIHKEVTTQSVSHCNFIIITRLFINNNHLSIMNQLCTENVCTVYHFINHSCCCIIHV